MSDLDISEARPLIEETNTVNSSLESNGDHIRYMMNDGDDDLEQDADANINKADKA